MCLTQWPSELPAKDKENNSTMNGQSAPRVRLNNYLKVSLAL